MFSSHLILKLLLHMHVIVCVCVFEFRERNYFKGEIMYNLGKFEFFQKMAKR